MQHILGIDSPAYRVITKGTQLIYLSLLWVLTSLPLITIGASTTALYDVAGRMADNREGYLTRQFFHAFRQNFKQGTALWVIHALAGILFGMNSFYYWFTSEATVSVLQVAFLIFFLFNAGVMSYTFCALAKFENSVRGTLLFATIMFVKNIGWSVLMLLFQALAAVVVIHWNLLPLFLVPGLVVYLDAFILNRMIDLYLNENKITVRKQEATNETD